jgi:hypothetical protein
VLNFLWMKGQFRVPFRLLRELAWAIRKKPTRLRYTPFQPNYEAFLLPDSDARSSLDNHEVLIWFLSRGFVQPEGGSWLSRTALKCGALVLVKGQRNR